MNNAIRPLSQWITEQLKSGSSWLNLHTKIGTQNINLIYIRSEAKYAIQNMHTHAHIRAHNTCMRTNICLMIAFYAYEFFMLKQRQCNKLIIETENLIILSCLIKED